MTEPRLLIPYNPVARLCRNDLEYWLPHRDLHLCLHETTYYYGSDLITGYWYPGLEYFHFKVLPGHWTGESACLAGGIFGQLFDKSLRGTVPLMDYVHVIPKKPVFYQENEVIIIIHYIRLRKKNGRSLTFDFISKDSTGAIVAIGEFAGTAVPGTTFKKMLARKLKSE